MYLKRVVLQSKIRVLFPEEGRKEAEWTKTANVHAHYSIWLQATSEEDKGIKNRKALKSLTLNLSIPFQLPSPLTLKLDA